MIEKVNKLLSMQIEEIIATEISLTLLKCYSMLYMNGAAPGTCARSQQKYYNQLQKNGRDMALNYEEINSRTLKPAWKGLKYCPKACNHYNDETITDKQAISLLKNGAIQEESFLILPEGYISANLDTANTKDEDACILEFAQRLEDGEAETQIKESCKGLKKIGSKKCNAKLIDALIKQAKELNEATK